jgi:hypothetical protein
MHIIAFPSPLEPLPQQLLTIAVQGSRVPVYTSEFVGAVEELESLLVRGWCPVKGLAGVSDDVVGKVGA